MKSMVEFSNFLADFGKSPEIYQSTLDGINQIMTQIMKHKDDLHSQKFLPLNALHSEKCMREIRLAQDTNINEEERD
jgi:hypothetical protein